MRRHRDAIVAFFLHLVQRLEAQNCVYEALDSSAVPTRDAKRRGAGWLPGLADIGWSNRLGWYEGFSRTPWPKALRRWLASIRQIVETVFEKLHNLFRLNRERPHDLSGFQARLAAKMALSNFCV
jgi:hypothetical protein